jgi:hypothetical protein
MQPLLLLLIECATYKSTLYMIASAARAIGHAVQQFDKMIVSSAAL